MFGCLTFNTHGEDMLHKILNSRKGTQGLFMVTSRQELSYERPPIHFLNHVLTAVSQTSCIPKKGKHFPENMPRYGDRTDIAAQNLTEVQTYRQ